MSKGGSLPAVANATLAPSLVFAYWMRGSMAVLLYTDNPSAAAVLRRPGRRPPKMASSNILK